jgi:hypothetical protein
LSVNEIRSLENLNPVDDGDVRFVQLNMTTLEKAAAEPEEPVPVVEEIVVEEQPAEPVAEAPSVEQPQLAEVSLNGAQITGILEILAQLNQGLLTAEAAKALMLAAFPSLPVANVDQIIAGTSTQPLVEPEPVAEPVAPEEASQRAAPYVEGEWVTLPDGRVGRVDHVMTEGVLNLGDVEMPATPDAPVALVSVWEGESFGEPVPVAVADLQAAEEPEAARAYGSPKPKRKPRRRDCGSGAGGFKPGNKCAGEGGGGSDTGGSGGAGQSPGGGLKPPSEPHNIRVPKDPKRLTIDQADSAMKQMGYEVGETVTQKEGGSWVSKTAYSDSDGKSTTLTANEVTKFVYANHSDPDIAKIKVPGPRKRRGG